MRANLHFTKKKEREREKKAQARNDWSNILPKSLQVRKTATTTTTTTTLISLPPGKGPALPPGKGPSSWDRSCFEKTSSFKLLLSDCLVFFLDHVLAAVLRRLVLLNCYCQTVLWFFLDHVLAAVLRRLVLLNCYCQTVLWFF